MTHDLIGSILQGGRGFEPSQLAMDHMLLGASKGKHLMQGFGEVVQAALWIIG